MAALSALAQELSLLLADAGNELRAVELPAVSKKLRDMVSGASEQDLGGQAVAREVFGSIIEVIIGESISTGQVVSKVSSLSFLKTLFGDNHAYLIDIYGALSVSLEEDGKVDEARELAGQSLLVAMHVFGLMHIKTGECHLRLGLLFGKRGVHGKDVELSRKELLIARGVFRNQVGTLSNQVGDCEFYLADTEGSSDKAFNHLHSSYMCRYHSLGERHRSTVAMRTLMEEKRRFRGTDAFLAVEEVQFRLQDMKWNEAGSASIQFTIAMFIRHILENRERAITCKQLREIMVAALRHHNNAKGRNAVLSMKMLSPISGGGGSPLKALSTPEYQIIDRLHKEFITGLFDGDILTTPSSPHGSGSLVRVGNGTSSKSLHDFVVKWHKRSPSSPLSPPKPEVKSRDHKESNLRLRLEAEDTQARLSIAVKDTTVAVTESKVNDGEEGAQADGDNHQATILEASMLDINKLAILQEQYLSIGVNAIESSILPFSLAKNDTTLAMDKNREIVAIQRLASLINDRTKAQENESLKMDRKSSYNPSDGTNAIASATGKEECPVDRKNTVRGDMAQSNSSSPPPPPPLPKSWPPFSVKLTVDYIFRQAGAEDASTSANSRRKSMLKAQNKKAKGDEDSPAVATFTSDSGKVITGAFAAKKAEEAQKLKKSGITVEIVSLKISDLSGTVFDKSEGLDENELIPLDDLFEDLEDEFVKQKKRKSMSVMRRMSRRISTITKSADDTIRSDSARKFDQANGSIAKGSVLDPRRDQNLSIMLARFGKQKCVEIAAAVYNFQYEKLGLTASTALSQYIPTEDEIRSVGTYIESIQKQLHDSSLERIVDKMSRSEQYVYYLGKVPHLSKTLSAMTICLNNAELAQKCRRDADEIIRACHEIKASVRLKYVLQKLLQLLASINNKGLTESTEGGFRLSTLQSLTKTKTNSGDSIEQYFVCRLYNAVPESLDLAHDLPSVTNSHKVSLNDLASGVKILKEGMETTRELLQDLRNSEMIISETGFDHNARLASLSKKAEEFESMHDQSADLLKEATDEFNGLCLYFGEDPKDTSPNEIFGALRDFASRVSFCIDQITSKAKRIARRKSQIEV